MNGNPPFLDPSPIMRLSTAYWDSQVFLTANRVGLFECLAAGAKTPEEAAEALGLHPRPTRLLLNACAALGLVEKQGGQYANSAMSDFFLVSGKPSFMGNAVRYSDDLYGTWGRLEEALRQNRPVLPPAEYLGDDEERTRHFVHGMHNRALGIASAMVNLVDLAGRKQLLDVGGGPGTYSCLLARKFPELRCKVMDLPGVAAHAEGIIQSLGGQGRVETLPGDYHSTPFPGGNDVVLISGVFHRESEAGCRSLIAKAKDSLAEGGLLVVSDVFADEGGASPAFATLFGLNMLLTAQEGGVHSDAGVAAWMEEAGFRAVARKPFPPPMPHRLVHGLK